MAPVMVERVVDVIHLIRKEVGMSVLLIEQNLRVAATVADRVTVMVNGEIAVRMNAREFKDELRTDRSLLRVLN